MGLVKVIESTGVAAIGIHGRYSLHERESHETIVTWPATHIAREQKERSRQPCHCDVIRDVAKALSIPVIAK